MQQYGVHPQLALAEVSGYIKFTADRAKKELLHSNDLEEFLDQMADKYFKNADKTAERIFGKSDFLNPDYMNLLPKKDDDDVSAMVAYDRKRMMAPPWVQDGYFGNATTMNISVLHPMKLTNTTFLIQLRHTQRLN